MADYNRPPPPPGSGLISSLSRYDYPPQGPPQGYYPPQQGYPQQGYPPPGQQPMHYAPQPPPEEKKDDKGCLYGCIATLCCCWLCGETCECCLDCLTCCF
ncbi:hypothetical protein HJFPF1_09878 [Paramyrothecium foliicola]|nr:hypothetical protein HJFPF1_09878 [Paramyrothecium foliicola]